MKRTLAIILTTVLVVTAVCIMIPSVSASAGDNLALNCDIPADGLIGCDPYDESKDLYKISNAADGILLDGNSGGLFKLFDTTTLYNIDGGGTDGKYHCCVTFDLKSTASVDSARLYAYGSNKAAFRQDAFDIYVSTTGAAGSWEKVWSGSDLRNDKYTEGTKPGVAYSYIQTDFGKTVSARYVRIGIASLRGDNYTHLMNLVEFEVYEAGGTHVGEGGSVVADELPGKGRRNVLPMATMPADGLIGCEERSETYSLSFITDGDINYKNPNGSVFNILDPKWQTKYSVDGTVGGDYIALFTFELEQTYRIDGFTYFTYHSSITEAAYRTEAFDVWTSTTGAAGSWTKVDTAKELLSGEKYVDGVAVGYKYSYYMKDISPIDAKFVRFAIVEGRNQSKGLLNVAEIEVYSGIGETVYPETSATEATTTPEAVTTTTGPVVTKTPTTKATTTEAPTEKPTDKPQETKAPADTTVKGSDKKNCGSIAIAAQLALLLSAGAAVIVIRKKR